MGGLWHNMPLLERETFVELFRAVIGRRYPVLSEVLGWVHRVCGDTKEAGEGQSAVLPESTLDPASLHGDR